LARAEKFTSVSKFNQAKLIHILDTHCNSLNTIGWSLKETGGVVKVEIYEVDTKIALYVDTF